MLQPVILRWGDASQAIDSALDRLHFLAAAIRKASAKQLEYNVATFLTDDDIVFRRDAASLVRWKFLAARKGLAEQLGDSIAIRRRMLLQKHRHATKLTVRRVVESSPSTKRSQDPERNPRPTTSPLAKDRFGRHLNVPASGVTKASRPDPQAPALRHAQLSRRPALTSVISTISTAPEDSFEYPPPPKIKEGETRIQCPYCLMPLDRGELKSTGDESRRNEYWRRHVDEDLKPYVCLFPECAEALVFFTRRHEWKSHMESFHSRDWPRRVHTNIWYCDIDHDPPERFETESQWRKHMKNLDSHPKRQLTEPTKAQLDALSPRMQQVALRDHFVCPLCEQIPEKIRPLAKEGSGNPEMYESLVDHIANHIKSLSLLSLPGLDNSPASLDTDGESIAIQDSFRRLMNQGSVPQPPSGIEYLDGVSLPPEVWSIFDHEEIATLTTPVSESAWDKEYSDYVPPDDPPELVDDEWGKTWKIWSDPPAQESVDLDPVIAHLKNSKVSVDAAQATAHTTILEDPDIKSKKNSEQLLSAASCGQEALVRLLLKKGADVESKDIKYSQTPLSLAAKNGHEAVVRLLLEMGADTDSKDINYGQTPLSWAAEEGHEAVVRLLLEKGADIESKSDLGQTPLSRAAEEGYEAVVRLLLEEGADVESKSNLGQTPLSWAAEEGHEAVVRLLLEKGADTDSKDINYGQTPLSRAAGEGHEAVVRLLLEEGADVESKSDLGQTPLLWAAEKGHEAVVRLLIEKGADTDSKDIKYGQTPLSRAAEEGHEAVVRLLLEKGADVESKDIHYGQTPLLWAAGNGHEAVVRLLLEMGADTESKDIHYGQTPLLWAAGKGHKAVVKLLIEKGANVESKANSGQTPLSRAAEGGHEAVVKLLRWL